MASERGGGVWLASMALVATPELGGMGANQASALPVAACAGSAEGAGVGPSSGSPAVACAVVCAVVEQPTPVSPAQSPNDAHVRISRALPVRRGLPGFAGRCMGRSVL